MVDYGLCGQKVTIYRMGEGGLQRQVAEGCFYAYEDILIRGVAGERLERKFLLVMPGAEQRVFPGDRIYDGIGPEQVDWEQFLPACVPGLSEAQYARAYSLNGQICHWEAGRK